MRDQTYWHCTRCGREHDTQKDTPRQCRDCDDFEELADEHTVMAKAIDHIVGYMEHHGVVDIDGVGVDSFRDAKLGAGFFNREGT